ncbi:kinase-like domain-containing protein [Coniochaeta sp. 2T2.1]|nr:kinase-like domain-containing protein [Coniochaeta sp. 2T2.1]
MTTAMRPSDAGPGAPMSPRSFAIAHRRPTSSFLGCSKIGDYEILNKLGEGTFGEVHRAQSYKTGAVVALKKIIMHNEKDGFPITAIREIKLLKLLSHPNILRLEDMAVEHPVRTEKRKRPIMYMVTPYMDHDLSGLLDNPSVHFTEPQIKCYMLQLLEGLKYLHESHILHRDMKAANLLINNKGVLQIADFGLARHYEGDIPRPGNGGGEAKREYTALVVTRWYRPPELLMHLTRYTTAIDLWGVGCVFGEMLVGKPILTGNTDLHQLELIFDLCGTPTEETMPGWKSLPGPARGEVNPRPRPGDLSRRFREYGSGAISLLRELLRLDWRKRINANDALSHPYFTNAPLPAKPDDIPTFEASHEFDRRDKHDNRKAALPPAPKGGTVGRGVLDNHNSGPNSGFNTGEGFHGRNGANGAPRYNSRNGPPGPPPGGERRQGGWRDHDLPPRPPAPRDYPNGVDHPADGYRGRGRDGPPRGRGGGGGGGGRDPPVDTYIPAYDRDGGAAAGRREPPPREDRRGGWHDRDDRPRDWERRARIDYDDRSRNSRTRSRSRSPIVRDRDRDRNRYRD